jgi:hypothetical protein
MQVDARWVDDMPSASAQRLIRAAFETGALPDMTRNTVRAKGAEYWMGFPGVGRKIVKALDEAVGGFDPPPEGRWERDQKLAYRDKVNSVVGKRPPLPSMRDIMDRLDLHTARYFAITTRLDVIENTLKDISTKLDRPSRVQPAVSSDAEIVAIMRLKEEQWLAGLDSALARRHIREAFDAGEIANMSRTAVRQKGKQYWMRRHGLGIASVIEIAKAVGGLV